MYVLPTGQAGLSWTAGTVVRMGPQSRFKQLNRPGCQNQAEAQEP